MKHIKVKFSVILFLVCGLAALQAQETIPATGGEASGSGGSVSYTAGQVVYQTHTGTNGSVAEGVQQVYEITVVEGIEEATGIELMLSAYPNPTSDYLTLRVDEFETSDLSYQLYDIKGNLLESKKITDMETSIDMQNLVPSSYFVKVIKENTELKTFKIIKK